MTPYVFFAIIGYLSGSILFARIVPKQLRGVDVVRLSDDGNPGTANAFAFAGPVVGSSVLILELAKGFAPVYHAAQRLDTANIAFSLVLAAPVLGHAFPVYWGFKGGGKAIAFIPWGTDNPDWGDTEIDSITVYDCVLKGGYAVGTWPDNPYFGKQPFDNTEQDAYSPIKNVRIYRNSYLSPCDLLCIRPTNFISDCGIRSSGTFQNGNFEHGRAYWTMRGDAGVRDGCGYADGGRLYEGLYLTRGRHTFTAEVQGDGSLYADRLSLFEESVPIARADFSSETWTQRTLTVDIPEERPYALGIDGNGARIRKAAGE